MSGSMWLQFPGVDGITNGLSQTVLCVFFANSDDGVVVGWQDLFFVLSACPFSMKTGILLCRGICLSTTLDLG